MLSKTIEYLPLSLVTQKGESTVAFSSFGVFSGSFHAVPTYSNTEYFDLQILVKMNFVLDFITNSGKRY